MLFREYTGGASMLLDGEAAMPCRQAHGFGASCALPKFH